MYRLAARPALGGQHLETLLELIAKAAGEGRQAVVVAEAEEKVRDEQLG